MRRDDVSKSIQQESQSLGAVQASYRYPCELAWWKSKRGASALPSHRIGMQRDSINSVGDDRNPLERYVQPEMNGSAHKVGHSNDSKRQTRSCAIHPVTPG
jgi:hypothetical protein